MGSQGLSNCEILKYQFVGIELSDKDGTILNCTKTKKQGY